MDLGLATEYDINNETIAETTAVPGSIQVFSKWSINVEFKNLTIVTAQLNLNSSWEWHSNSLDHPPTTTYPVKLLGHFQATQEADFWYATFF